MESITYTVYTGIFATLIPSSLLLGLRFYARRLKRVPLWWDDYLAVLALVSAIAYDIAAFVLMSKGLGRHLSDLHMSVDEARYYQAMFLEIHEHMYTVAIAAAQLSLLALYWRIFSSITGPRICIYIFVALVGGWCLVRLVVAVFQCFPPRYLWDKSVAGGVCTVNPAKFFLWSVSAHLVIDVALMVLPATQISRLLLPWPQKMAIAVMFMFGIVVVIASIMMLVASSRYDSDDSDVMWNCTPALMWSAVEIHLSVIACCLPVMRPVIHALGGWWGHNFSSRKCASAPTYNPVKLGLVHHTAGAVETGESTHNLTNSPESSLTAMAADSGRIYGQGAGSDTVISTGKAGEKLRPVLPTRSTNGAILVQHEIDMKFSRRASQGR
ncbi:uncharacterized protein MAM_08137 [Metarhizium album ARSEF 1941]|uniref:Integral membrane protein n=1 Tax=Metarhizium album (strain ARSEF 1941) TaxID=1081103 RepID=A0A0B2WJB5_METAS|nr:uncharacterized protein MAM_08137 [Metarhizium album ARSEF 1941]KHN94008.1 integral membrane protein [Metarhizium album ARSEF 1941]